MPMSERDALHRIGANVARSKEGQAKAERDEFVGGCVSMARRMNWLAIRTAKACREIGLVANEHAAWYREGRDQHMRNARAYEPFSW